MESMLTGQTMHPPCLCPGPTTYVDSFITLRNEPLRLLIGELLVWPVAVFNQEDCESR